MNNPCLTQDDCSAVRISLPVTRTRSTGLMLSCLCRPQDDSDEEFRKPAPRKRPAAAGKGAAKPKDRKTTGKERRRPEVRSCRRSRKYVNTEAETIQ